MDIRFEVVDKRRVRFVIKEGDYTIGNLIQQALLADENVETAGYYISHPLIKDLIFEVRFKRAVKDPVEVIRQDVERLKEGIEELKRRVEELKGRQ